MRTYISSGSSDDLIRPEYISLQSQVDEPISWCPPSKVAEDTTLYLLVSKAGAQPQALKLVNGSVIEVAPDKLPFRSALVKPKRKLDPLKIAKALGTITMYLAALLALAGTLAINTGHLGARMVLTDSMSGTLEPGDVVVTANWLKPEVGQIAIYGVRDFQGNLQTEYIHRVIGFNETRGYDFKGDFNQTKDPLPVQPEDVIGVLIFYIPQLGIYLQPNFVMAYIAAGVFIYLAFGYFRDVWFERKHFRRRPRGNA